MKRILLLTCFGVLLSCNCQNTSNRRNSIDDPAQVTTSYSATNEDTGTGVAEDASGETLNDIRFAGWTRKEWADNEYIREVRKHIDAYNRGEIEDPGLDEYKEYIKGKFVIGDIKPGLWGGAFMYIVFFDHPDKTFSVLVYSDVDEETRTVSNYKCYGLQLEDFDLGYSQEDILQFLKECPEHRLW